MDKIKAVIVDDEPEAQDILENLVTNYENIEVLAKNSSVDEALRSILMFHPNLVFLDIDMPQRNGFDLVKDLKKLKVFPTIVFVTAYNHYAVDAIKHAAFDYLIKPIDIDELHETINRYRLEKQFDSYEEKIDNLFTYIKSERIRFRTKTGGIFICPQEIIYCHADGNYSHLFVRENGAMAKKTVTYNLGKLLKILPDYFSRVSRSVVINTQCLLEVNRKNKTCLISSPDGEKVFDVPKCNIDQLLK